MSVTSTDPKYLQQAQRLLAHPLMSTFKLHEKAGIVEDGVFYLWDGMRCRADWVGEDLIEYIKLVHGMNDPLETRTYLDALTELKDRAIIVLEAGAGGGQFSLHALHYHPNAKAVLVEAHPRHYAITCDHMVMNNVADTSQVIHAAITAKEGQIVRFQGDVGYGSYVSNQGNLLVPTVSLVSLIRDLNIPFLHILHMDIQGVEADVLHASQRLLAKSRIGYLFIGTHSNELHQKCKDILLRHSYTLIVDVSPTESAIGDDGLLVAKLTHWPRKNEAAVYGKRSAVKRYHLALQRRLAAILYRASKWVEVLPGD